MIKTNAEIVKDQTEKLMLPIVDSKDENKPLKIQLMLDEIKKLLYIETFIDDESCLVDSLKSYIRSVEKKVEDQKLEEIIRGAKKFYTDMTLEYLGNEYKVEEFLYTPNYCSISLVKGNEKLVFKHLTKSLFQGDDTVEAFNSSLFEGIKHWKLSAGEDKETIFLEILNL